MPLWLATFLLFHFYFSFFHTSYSNLVSKNTLLNTTPFYEKDINYKKANMLYDFTEEEIEEYQKCANDAVYFTNKFAFSMTDDGVRQIKLRDYQIEVLKSFQENRFCCLKASRFS